MSNLKILYGAGNSINSKIQLMRFIQSIKNKPYQLKIAAYNISTGDLNIDWTLDCLLNICKPTLLSTDSENFQIYFEQIKNFAPDLIISDLEYFTSYAGHLLDIPVWQCSSILINFALANKYNIGLFKNYSYVLNRDFAYNQRMINIIDNSAFNLVYSHFGDVVAPPELKENFSWITPYYSIGKISPPCQHRIVAGSFDNSKKIISAIKTQPDCVLFSEYPYENYGEIKMKYLYDTNEYFCNLRNCDFFFCSGYQSFLSDAFYNEKHSIIMPSLLDSNSLINSIITEKLGLGSIVYDTLHLEDMTFTSFQPITDYQLFLHEKIEQIFC